jgi:hypothetical protein
MCCTYTPETPEIGPKRLDSGRELDAIESGDTEKFFEENYSHTGTAQVTDSVVL